MDDLIIKYTTEDTPYILAGKIQKITGGYLPVKITFEESALAKGIINNSKIKNLEEGLADKFIEGLILGGIPPGRFRISKDDTTSNPYSITLIYENI